MYMHVYCVHIQSIKINVVCVLNFDQRLAFYATVDKLASYPGDEGKEPGTHCMCMHAITPEFQGDMILLEYARILMMSY